MLMARRRRRGKVLKELKCGSGEALEVRTSQGRREAAPEQGSRKPSRLWLQEHKSALFGAGILLLVLLPPPGLWG